MKGKQQQQQEKETKQKKKTRPSRYQISSSIRSRGGWFFGSCCCYCVLDIKLKVWTPIAFSVFLFLLFKKLETVGHNRVHSVSIPLDSFGCSQKTLSVRGCPVDRLRSLVFDWKATDELHLGTRRLLPCARLLEGTDNRHSSQSVIVRALFFGLGRFLIENNKTTTTAETTNQVTAAPAQGVQQRFRFGKRGQQSENGHGSWMLQWFRCCPLLVFHRERESLEF